MIHRPFASHLGRRRLAPRWCAIAVSVIAVAAAVLSSCGGDYGPTVSPGTLVVSDPAVDWVARIAWSDDGDELAFLGTAVAGELVPYRASLTDASLLATAAGGMDGASELRYVPGGRDLLVAGRPSLVPPVACGPEGVAIVRGDAAVAIVGCPYQEPFGVLGRADSEGVVQAEVDPDQFVAVHPMGSSVVVPSGDGARWLDLASLETRDLGPGFPVAFDPSGERVVVVETDSADWARQSWSIVSPADGARTPLPVATDRFGRGYHVIGVRWLAEGLLLLVERDLADGSEWLTWNLGTAEERVLGPATAEVGAFPLGRVPRWSASGRLLAFREYACLRESVFYGCAVPQWSVVVVDLVTGERRLAYRGQAFVDVPAIAPGDRSVAFAVGGKVYLKELP